MFAEKQRAKRARNNNSAYYLIDGEIDNVIDFGNIAHAAALVFAWPKFHFISSDQRISRYLLSFYAPFALSLMEDATEFRFLARDTVAEESPSPEPARTRQQENKRDNEIRAVTTWRFSLEVVARCDVYYAREHSRIT